MNILAIQDKLKNFSQEQLVQEMQMPTGQLPQFLLLSEITRRKKMQDSYAQQQDQGQEQTTVAQDAINAAGMPQGAAQQLAGTMAPQTDMAGNTGAAPQQQMMPQAPQPVQGMAGGGIVALRDGGRITSPRIVVRNGQQMLEMPDGSIVPASPDSLRARLELISRMTDPDSSLLARLADFGTQPRVAADVTGETSSDAVNPSYVEDRPDRFPSISDVAPMSTPATPIAPGAAADTVFTPRPSPQRTPNEGPARFSGLDERLNRVLYPNDPDYGDPFRPQVMDDTVDPYAAMGSEGVPPMSPRPAQINESADPYAAVGSEGVPPMSPRRELAPSAPQSVPDVVRALEEYYPGSGYEDVMRGGPRMPPPTQEPPPPGDGPSFSDALSRRPGTRGLGDRILEDMRVTSDAVLSPFTGPNTTSGPGEGLDPITSDSLLPPAAVPTATPPGPPGPPGGGGGRGIAGAAAQGAGAPSDFEQELMTMLAAREKRAEQDKWLALAQAGMALMSSTQPTFGGALGEAGASGLGALREGQSGAEADRLALLGQIEQSRLGREQVDLQRQALAARMASGGGGGAMQVQDPSAFGMTTDEDRQLQLFLQLAESPNPETQLTGQRGVDELMQRVRARSNMGGAGSAQPDLVTQ